VQLAGYTDADWTGDAADRRSMSGFAFTLGSAAIAWSSKKQPTVALSSTEAEYRGAAFATCEDVWLKRLLKDLKEEVSDPIVIYSDNLSSIQLAKNPVFHARTKHIEVHYHFVRERVLSGKVELRYVPTDRQTADIFTKPLGLDKLRQFSGVLGLRHLDVPNLRGRNDQTDQGGRKEQERKKDTRDVERADARNGERKKDTRDEERADARDEERRKDTRDVARKKKAEPDEAEPVAEKADDYESRSGGADDSERASHSESADERRCDSEMLNQPRPKRMGETQRMRQRRDSRKAEKGRRRPEGSKRREERTEMHARGRPKDRTTDMQTEIRGKAKTRRHGKPCNTGTPVTPET
jgi:hypothetical protein